MKQPNIVFIFSDHHRWDYLGHRNAKVHTPNLDRMVARGTSLERMYSTTPLCVPQRIALTTGQYPGSTGCYTNRHRIPPGSPSFVRSVQNAGYETALVGKLHHHVHAMEADFTAHREEVHQLGYDRVWESSGKQGSGLIRCRCDYAEFLDEAGILEDYYNWTGEWGKDNGSMQSNEPWPWDSELTQDAVITRKAIEFLNTRESSKPFYLHYGLVGPHPPFDAPVQFREFYEEIDPPEAVGPEERDVERWKAFAACITEVDYRIGQFLAELDRLGLAQNTIILYTSDHGEMAGDHGRFGKGTFYEGSARVPCIAAGPGIPENRSVSAMAELIDVGTTFVDIAGGKAHDRDQGISFLPALTGQSDTHREDCFAEMGSDKMLFDGRFKLMYGDVTRDTRDIYKQAPFNGSGFGRPVNLIPDKISLFDLSVDPQELNNLADSPQHADVLQRMKNQLLDRMIQNSLSNDGDPGSVL